MTPNLPRADCAGDCSHPEVARRDFLFGAGAALLVVSIPGVGVAQGKRADYPKKKVALLSKLKKGEPVVFRYPWDHANCESVLLKLGRVAGGGIGPDKDVVAFNGLCPHMGWALPAKAFRADPGIAGPCAGHLTAFDLTRHGTVVSGHATQGLPQVVLELDGDDILAVGVLGLLFGFHDNRAEPK